MDVETDEEENNKQSNKINKKTIKTGSKQINKKLVYELIIAQCNKLQQIKAYAPIKNEINTYKQNISEDKCDRLFTTLISKVNFKSSDAFLSTYYGHIIQFGGIMLPDLSESTSKILLIKLGDTLYSAHQKQERQLVEDSAYVVSERQLAGLQYLSGYVIHKLHRKLKNNKRWNTPESQIGIMILEACRECDHSKQSNQKLVSALSRGGLWYVCMEAQKIFIIAEKYFLRKTAGKPNPTLKINKVITDITGFSYVKDFFGEIIKKIDIDTESENFKIVSKDILFSMIQLYIRVRMFSLVRDYVQQMKAKKGKEKSLRKTLKRKEDEKVCI